MKRILKKGNIVETGADALIYSTNVQLMLSGGVGASLLMKYGIRFQDALFKCSAGTGRQLAEVGDIFTTDIAECPWKVVFHTIATDPFYHTDPLIVSSILERCFLKCCDRGDISTIVTSPLGAGYGDLSFPVFMDIATAITDDPRFQTVDSLTVCCDDDDFFSILCKHVATLDKGWEIAE